ncbi:MAG: TerB family tellurite resistance protein [Geminicoccaceae bacterium]|nr:TerB family tellurite resistance protein [Xanthomonadales bacterium]MCB1992933.1 TerB family tellurite resistance protein [Geminicoccaceae bacterium]
MPFEEKQSGGLGGLIREIRSVVGGLVSGGKLEPEKEMAIDVLFGLLGVVAGADSIVTTHEAEFVNETMDEIGLSGKGREMAFAAFNRGRRREVDIDADLSRLLKVYPKGSQEVARIFDSLIKLAASDGRMRPSEKRLLEDITAKLGYSSDVLDQRLQQAGF